MYFLLLLCLREREKKTNALHYCDSPHMAVAHLRLSLQVSIQSHIPHPHDTIATLTDGGILRTTFSFYLKQELEFQYIFYIHV